jgi:TonB-dependent SusC/RagA subfamily outer membrane receptor
MRLGPKIMSVSIKLSLFGVIILLNNGLVWAQERVISGTVFDENKEGLPGVNIILKGTTNGTISDYNGSYTVNMPEAGAVLVMSAIGYSTKEITIGARAIIDVTMTVNVEELEEVIVIGYGTRAKRDLTGSVATVSQKELSAIPVISADLALQGRTAGVIVTQNSGAPGAATSIKIRGTSSISAGNEPLYVIDGVPILSSVQDITTGSSKGDQMNPLSTINPNDIVSMEVLKDASAAAIYGARGANGVIIITTKRGKLGSPKL